MRWVSKVGARRSQCATSSAATTDPGAIRCKKSIIREKPRVVVPKAWLASTLAISLVVLTPNDRRRPRPLIFCLAGELRDLRHLRGIHVTAPPGYRSDLIERRTVFAH